jgi:hypothetical protein
MATVKSSFVLVAAALAACSSTHATPMAANQAPAMTQSPANWISLADPSRWRGYKAEAIPAGWMFANGVLSKTRPVEDLVSRDQFGDFEFELEWRIGSAGNSGIFYRGTEEYDHIYWSAPEYQLLDNVKAADNKTALTRAAAVYGLYPAPDGHVKEVGEWNATRIVARGNHVEHWLNGFLMEQYELGSPDWEARVKASKFAAWPNYGKARRGHLALQGDHTGELAFRNMRIRELR